ncbi:hypothetical protein ACVIIV_005083 [Bradyrhizobium sp. USDA 4354]
MERCIAETTETLRIQQRQLLEGRRAVQMFPAGTPELPLPEGLERHETARGVFHFRPERISSSQIETLSSIGRENEFLNLGPFSKADIVDRVNAGEQLVCLTERAANGTEIRSAAATASTISVQRQYFETTKEPDSSIEVRGLVDVLAERF